MSPAFRQIAPALAALLQTALEREASDLHLVEGEPPWYRIGGALRPDTEQGPIPDLSPWWESLTGSEAQGATGARDGAMAVEIGGQSCRFRYNLFIANGRPAIALRRLENEFRELKELGLSERLYELCDLKDGLVLIAGPTGSGKSTTLATLIDRINRTRPAHIITIEDPIEYVHVSLRSLVSQRQVGSDTPGFHAALKDAVRQDPDVILVGELRDLDTIRTAVSAAETGHLVFATIHGSDTIGALDRLVGSFPGNEQPMIQQALSGCLRAAIAQHLLPGRQGRDAELKDATPRVLASEVLRVNSAISNLLATGQLTQARSILETSAAEGMYTLDSSLARLWRSRRIDESLARSLARNPQLLMELARRLGS